MGKILIIDETLCYFRYQEFGDVKVVGRSSIQEQLRERFGKKPISFQDYLQFSAWHPEFKSQEKENKRYEGDERDLFNYLVGIYPDNQLNQKYKKGQISPRALINLLECFCWLSGNYEADCLILSNSEYDYSIHKITKSLFGLVTKDRVLSFRFSEFTSLSISEYKIISIETKFVNFDFILDKSRPNIVLNPHR